MIFKFIKRSLALIISGALILGAPVCIPADSSDLSGEGMISKPSHYSTAFSDIDDSTANTEGYYTIMGATTVSIESMIDQYTRKGMVYPGAALADGGAPDLATFCTILVEEANAEGVRAEVVYAQSMLETGYLQYGGDSNIKQYNFAGLGTTGGGVEGIYFPDVRTGLRAQVQHLKAYASTEPLNQLCVDERFQLVRRESAPYVEWLGVQENPYGGGWATGANYGSKLLTILADLKNQ